MKQLVSQAEISVGPEVYSKTGVTGNLFYIVREAKYLWIITLVRDCSMSEQLRTSFDIVARTNMRNGMLFLKVFYCWNTTIFL